MLDDIRPVLADILDGLCYTRRAETLRWLHEYETTPRGDEIAELECLREFVDNLDELFTHPPIGARGAVKLSDQVTAIRELLTAVRA